MSTQPAAPADTGAQPAAPAGIGAEATTRGGRVPYSVAARELLRDSLLDAAHELLEERSWSEVTMADVARGAGVSRQTLYNEFGTRQEFVQAHVLREGERFLSEVEEAVRAHLENPRTAIAAAFDVFLESAAQNHLIRAIATGEGADELLPLVTVEGSPLLVATVDRLTTIIREGWPRVSEREGVALAEALVRLAISHIAMPSGPAGLDGTALARLLGPYLDELVS